jgi:hypothetical protein
MILAKADLGDFNCQTEMTDVKIATLDTNIMLVV